MDKQLPPLNIPQEQFNIPSSLQESDLKAALESIQEIEQNARVNVYESVFREFFKDEFLGLVPAKEAYLRWLGLVNGPHRWANVIHDTEQTLLFEVPPMFQTGMLDVNAPKDPNRPTVANVIDMAIINTNNRPMQRVAAVRDQTLKYLAPRVSGNVDPACKAAWLKVYAFYGVKVPGEQEQAPEAPSEALGGGLFQADEEQERE